MEGDDRASAQMIDKVYANGGHGSAQCHRPIINGDRLNDEPYAAFYGGRTKITHLLFIADHCDVVSTQWEVLRMAYDEVKRRRRTVVLPKEEIRDRQWRYYRTLADITPK
ncbi:hypothetical protein U1Q18_034749 [Sarracenia purpurea var. burkii]